MAKILLLLSRFRKIEKYLLEQDSGRPLPLGDEALGAVDSGDAHQLRHFGLILYKI